MTLVHKQCHPKDRAAEVFAQKWDVLGHLSSGDPSTVVNQDDDEDDEERI